MPTKRRTATYDTTLLVRVERLRSSEAHRQALVELTGAEPRSLASTLSDLTALAVALVERRVIQRGYRQLAAEREAEYDVDVADVAGSEPVVVVSNNVRNRVLDSVDRCSVTTSPNRPAAIPSVVPIDDRGAILGRVLCDDLATVRTARLGRRVGALPPRVMLAVDAGLRAALDCESSSDTV